MPTPTVTLPTGVKHICICVCKYVVDGSTTLRLLLKMVKNQNEYKQVNFYEFYTRLSFSLSSQLDQVGLFMNATIAVSLWIKKYHTLDIGVLFSTFLQDQ